MNNRRVVFLLGGLIACCGDGAFAASSVRMLGTNATPSNNIVAQNPQNSVQLNSVRRSTLPLRANPNVSGTKTVTPTAVNSNMINTMPNRLSILGKNLKNIKNTVSTGGTSGGNSGSAVNTDTLNELSNRMDALQHRIDGMPTVADLSQFYTRAEVDELVDDTYTVDEIDAKLLNVQSHLSDIDTEIQNISTASGAAAVQEMQNTVTQQGGQIEQLQFDTKTIYDAVADERVPVTIVDTFNVDEFFGTSGIKN
ncbi:MAG: hypothetical protein J5608_03515 [Alphaproteobacteria bacterium]|nr:hypothetical protein [Alphaproteobacteria bacterium]